jgi:hypothetical protein
VDFYLTLGENSFMVSKNCKNYFVHTFMNKYIHERSLLSPITIFKIEIKVVKDH